MSCGVAAARYQRGERKGDGVEGEEGSHQSIEGEGEVGGNEGGEGRETTLRKKWESR